VYLHAWQVTGEPFYRTITEEVLDYIVREMTDPAGGFTSAQDADSEGEEGKFFVWELDEIHGVLGDQANRFIKAYGVSERGNFEGKNILELKGSLQEREILAEARKQLFAAREQRVHPGRDDQVLVSWNGLMLAACAEAARVLKREDYRHIAERNAEFLLSELKATESRLYHTWKDGIAKFNGYLEDYTHLVEGLLELYQTTFDPRWAQAAQELADVLIARFAAPEGGFFDTSDDHEPLVTRPRELQDNVEPHSLELVHTALGTMQPTLAHYPLGFAQWLIALNYALAHPREIAIVGEVDAPDTIALLNVVAGYRPHQVVALSSPNGVSMTVPLLLKRGQVEGRATAYVCVDSVCRPPVTAPEALQELL
jgi:uncharacterized protein YyaL (SSP411 family)